MAGKIAKQGPLAVRAAVRALRLTQDQQGGGIEAAVSACTMRPRPSLATERKERHSTLIPSRDDRLRIRLSARMVLRTDCICLCVCSCVARRMFRRACMARRTCVRVWSPCRSAESPPSPVSSEVMVCAQSACVVGVYRVSLCSDGSKATMKCASPNPAAQVAATTKRTTAASPIDVNVAAILAAASSLGVDSGSCTQVRC